MEINHLGEPGAVRYGNFMNYYSFHSPESRIKNLDNNVINTAVESALKEDNDLVCLDIGCNSGNLTQALYNYFKDCYSLLNVRFLGADIDPILINRASEFTSENLKFICLDIMSENSDQVLESYLQAHNRTKFDVVFCFSLTMWIHLNHGDDGLQKFLETVKKIAKTIIIEPQPWKCYKTAQRRLKRSNSSFPLFDSIVIKDNVDAAIENYITNGNNFVKLHESSPSPWNRRVLSFRVTK